MPDLNFTQGLLDLDSSVVSVSFRRGLAYFLIQEYDFAYKEFSFVVEKEDIHFEDSYIVYGGAYYILGLIQMEGYGRSNESDFMKALVYFKKSLEYAKENNDLFYKDSYNQIANIYRHGSDQMCKNYFLAKEYYYKAYLTGYFPNAGLRLGELYALENNTKLAKDWFNSTINELNNPDDKIKIANKRWFNCTTNAKYPRERYSNFAKCSIAFILLKSEDYQQAFSMYSKLEGKCYGIPECNMGLMLKYKLVPENSGKHSYKSYLNTSSKNKCALGQFYYGFEKEKEKKYKDAMTYYEQAWTQKNSMAANRIGCIYFNGAPGYKKNTTKALEYFNLAVRHGYDEAKFNIGLVLRDNDEHILIALQVFKDYCKEIDPINLYKAYYEISKIYNRLGQYNEEIKWALKAANSGIAAAQLLIGSAYLFGREKNHHLAYRYLKNAQNDKNEKKEATELISRMIEHKFVSKETPFQTLEYVTIKKVPIFAGRAVTFSRRLV